MRTKCFDFIWVCTESGVGDAFVRSQGRRSDSTVMNEKEEEEEEEDEEETEEDDKSKRAAKH
jgi:hypothetical protein